MGRVTGPVAPAGKLKQRGGYGSSLTLRPILRLPHLPQLTCIVWVPLDQQDTHAAQGAPKPKCNRLQGLSGPEPSGEDAGTDAAPQPSERDEVAMVRWPGEVVGN